MINYQSKEYVMSELNESKGLKRKKRLKKDEKLSSISLSDKRIIYLDGEIDDSTAKDVIDKLLRYDMLNHKDITIYINSPGGKVTAGLAIYDVMNYIKSDVSTICIGMCASMASILLINGTKGKRFILPNAEVMVHEVSGWTMGKVSELEDKVNHSKGLNYKLWKIIEKKTNKSVKDLKREATRKDFYLNAKMALKYGFVDSIIG